MERSARWHSRSRKRFDFWKAALEMTRSINRHLGSAAKSVSLCAFSRGTIRVEYIIRYSPTLPRRKYDTKHLHSYVYTVPGRFWCFRFAPLQQSLTTVESVRRSRRGVQ